MPQLPPFYAVKVAGSCCRVGSLSGNVLQWLCVRYVFWFCAQHTGFPLSSMNFFSLTFPEILSIFPDHFGHVFSKLQTFYTMKCQNYECMFSAEIVSKKKRTISAEKVFSDFSLTGKGLLRFPGFPDPVGTLRFPFDSNAPLPFQFNVSSATAKWCPWKKQLTGTLHLPRQSDKQTEAVKHRKRLATLSALSMQILVLVWRKFLQHCLLKSPAQVDVNVFLCARLQKHRCKFLHMSVIRAPSKLIFRRDLKLGRLEEWEDWRGEMWRIVLVMWPFCPQEDHKWFFFPFLCQFVNKFFFFSFSKVTEVFVFFFNTL